MAGPAKRDGEGAVKEDDADEGQKAEDQEGTRLVGSNYGEDHAGHDAHRPVADDPAQVGRC